MSTLKAGETVEDGQPCNNGCAVRYTVIREHGPWDAITDGGTLGAAHFQRQYLLRCDGCGQHYIDNTTTGTRVPASGT